MKDAEKALLMDALVNNPHLGITIINKDSIVVCRNKVNEDITGIKNTDLIGKHFSQVSHHKELLDVLEKGIPEFGQSLKTADGSQAVIHRIPLRVNNEIIGAASVTTFKDARDMEILLAKYDFVKSKLKHYDCELRKLRAAKYSLENIIGESDKIVTNKKLAETYAQGNSPVLITGETGTGKELFAHAIHLASPRRNGPFIRVNCGAIPAELIESELFGYEEGAFTGAKRGTKTGKVELANHGTIFLDEISLLTMPMQPKLLTVLQNHEIERIGGNRIMKIDFRVISATNRDLRQMVEEGTFRNDLYYRLGVLNLDISPLKERKGDIQILVQYFIEFFNSEYGFNISEVNPNVMDILSKWAWPGNVRELRNAVERAVQVSDKRCIRADDLPDYMVANWESTSLQYPTWHRTNTLKNSKNGVEKKLLESALISNNWNKSRASKQLGISRALLYNLIKKYDLRGQVHKQLQ